MKGAPGMNRARSARDASGGDISRQKKTPGVAPCNRFPAQGAFSWHGHRRPRLYLTASLTARS